MDANQKTFIFQAVSLSFAGMLAFLLWGSANAAEKACGISPAKAVYSAKLNTKSPVWLRIAADGCAELATPKGCVATCVLTRDWEMDCQSSGFSALASKAVLQRKAGVSGWAHVLQFGTWLDGYRSYGLTVEKDFSNPSLLAWAKAGSRPVTWSR